MREFHPPRRILLGPGPSDADPRVLTAAAAPLIGHLDPEFLKVMDDIQSSLRSVFQTRNRLTIPVSGTGSAGMEAAFANLVEPGDTVAVCVNGVFGERMADIVTWWTRAAQRHDLASGSDGLFLPECFGESLVA